MSDLDMETRILTHTPPLSEEHEKLRLRAREFATNHIAPAALKHDREQSVPMEVIRKAAEQGFYGMEFLTQLAFDPTGLSAAVVAEEFGYADAGIGLSILYPALPVTTLYLSATNKQIEQIAPTLLGDAKNPKLISLAASEPEAGSDVANYKTTAVKQPDGRWLLNGRKRWAGNAPDAETFFVIASLDLELGAKSQVVFIVDKETPGLKISKKMDKLGLRAIRHADIKLENVLLESNALLGNEKDILDKIEKAKTGVTPASMKTFTATRALVAALAVGVAASATDIAIAYAKKRSTFGKNIIEHQQVAATIADMVTKVQAARSLVYKACQMQSSGLAMHYQEASQAKLFAAQTVSEVTQNAIQIAGGLGFTENLPLEQKYRDAPIFAIFEGTNEIQKLLIASSIAGKKIR